MASTGPRFRHCSVCGSTRHDRRFHSPKARRARQRRRILPNLDAFYDPVGIIHPIRGSRGYSDWLLDQRKRERRELGIDVATQQVAAEWARAERRRYGGNGAREELEKLKAERAAMKEALEDEPGAYLTGLIRKAGAERGEIGHIPYEQARPILARYGLRPEKFHTATVTERGRKYLRWEYILDDVAQSEGYTDADALKAAVERAARDKAKLRHMDSEIAHLEAKLKAKRKPKGRAAPKKRRASTKTARVRSKAARR